MNGVIYAIRNLVTGACYIGQTRDYKKRRNAHRLALAQGCHKNPHLQNAWKKYGEDAFVFEETGLAADQTALDLLEIQTIAEFRNNGIELYNARAGGKGGGSVLSPETLRKMSEANLGKKRGPHSEETKRKISAGNKGKRLTVEQRRRISESQKGRITSEETKEKLRAAFNRPEHIQMLRERKTMLGKKQPEQQRRKMREYHRERLASKGELLIDGKKKCSGCKTIQDGDAFPADTRSADGVSPRCITCTREGAKLRQRTYQKRKRERALCL